MFGSQQDDISQGRYPDGSANLVDLPSPSPGAPNVGFLPPALEISLRDGVLIFQMATVTGARYQLEESVSVAPGAWNPVGPEIMGDGTVRVFEAAPPLGEDRFYRVRIMF
jgi:hypothetical protein